jgi:hypothetical protein
MDTDGHGWARIEDWELRMAKREDEVKFEGLNREIREIHETPNGAQIGLNRRDVEPSSLGLDSPRGAETDADGLQKK